MSLAQHAAAEAQQVDASIRSMTAAFFDVVDSIVALKHGQTLNEELQDVGRHSVSLAATC